MRRKRLFGLALVALAAAGLLSLLAYRVVKRGGVAKAPATAYVVAAAQPLAVGEVIQSADLKQVAMLPASLPQHVYTDDKQLVGHVLTAAAVPNQVIVAEMVAAPGTGVGLPPLIPPGMRAVSVKVNDVVSVAGFAVPGTHVDVLLTGNPTANNDPRTVTTMTLLSNVQVLTAGQQMEQSPNGKPEKVTVITLLVDPAGAEKLALADGFGHLQLALRNPLDRIPEKTAPLLNGSLYSEPVARHSAGGARSARRAEPAPAPAPQWAVEMITGDKHQIVNFPARSGQPLSGTQTAMASGDHHE